MNQVSVLRLEDLNAVAFIENRVVRFCAAHVIRILERWTRRKMERQQDPWVYMPIIRQEKELAPDSKNPTSWHQEMLGQFGKNAIKSALTILEEIGVVSKRRNPYNGQDRTYQYLLNFEELETLKTPSPSESDISPLKGDCSPIPQNTTHRSTFKKLEKGDRVFENSETKQEEFPKTPTVSNLEKELAAEFEKVAEDQGSAAAPESNFESNLESDFETLKQADLTKFQPPDDEKSLPFEFFRWVVAHRSLKLPVRPADPEVHAIAWIRKHGKIALRAFMEWKKASDRPVFAPTPPAEYQPRSPEQILAQYQINWHKMPASRQSIRDMIGRFPDWGIAIGEDGPCWKKDINSGGTV